MESSWFIVITLVTFVYVVSCDVDVVEPSVKKPKCGNVKKCKANEEYSHCMEDIGRAQYCSQKGLAIACRGSDAPCTEGCVCKKNYLRNNNGTCIPAGKCTTNCGPEEVLDDCPVDCASDYCPLSDEDSSLSCKTPSKDNCPAPVCKCRFNYRRALNGTCIPTTSCPPFDCSARPNEEYNSCPPLCPTDDCSQASPSGECPYGFIGIVLNCNPKCRCKPGYWRKDGTCVPYAECPKSCPPNEEYASCIQGVCRALNCTQRGQDIPCPDRDLPEEQCDSGCICKENYLRASNGSCVPEDQCGPPKCRDDEILDNCPTDSPRDYCPKSELDNEYPPRPDPCPPPACKCGFNRRRAENGSCILTRDCPPFDCSSRPNEVYTPCPPICPTDACSLQRLTGRCRFRIGIILECNPKCQCADGYGRSNGTCVPFEKCPNLCPINEEYSSCSQAVCRAQSCSDIGQPVACPSIAQGSCIRGCVCKENFYRNENGTCVSECQCKAPSCPNPNEEYRVSDIPNCPIRGLCKSIVSKFVCDQPQVAACVCKEGYLRVNETSPCIRACECPEMANSDSYCPKITN